MSSSTPSRPRIPPAFVLRAAEGLRRALLGLADRLVPAELALLEHATGGATAVGLHTVARLGIADAIGDGSKTARELASAANVDPTTLHRLLRQLASVGVFTIDGEGRFSNTRLSTALRTKLPSNSIRSFVEFIGGPAAIKALTMFEHSMMTGESSFDRSHGKTLWDHFVEHPAQGALFAQGMSEITQLSAPYVAAAYPFGELRTVCDVAGGRGMLLAEILVQHPNVRGVLLDADYVLDCATPFLEERGVSDRVERVVGDFFERIPEGYDAYLLKDILHDWDDAHCDTILGACRRATQPGSKLLIVENLLEDTQITPPVPTLDILMLVMTTGGLQRSVNQFRALLARSGFRLERVLTTPAIDIVEAIAI